MIALWVFFSCERIVVFLDRHLICHLIFLQLVLNVFLDGFLISSYCKATDITSAGNDTTEVSFPADVISVALQ